MPPPVIGFSPGLSILPNKKMGFVMKSKRTGKKRKMKSIVGLRKTGGKFIRHQKQSKKRRRRRRKKHSAADIPALMNVG